MLAKTFSLLGRLIGDFKRLLARTGGCLLPDGDEATCAALAAGSLAVGTRAGSGEPTEVGRVECNLTGAVGRSGSR